LTGIPVKQQELGDLFFSAPEERSAGVDSFGVPIDIAVYRDHGRDAHAT
jgi:hypothetical protein